MKHLCWSTLLLCVFANAENNAVWQEAGKKVTLKCSSAGCPSSNEGYDGMYLYHSRDQDHKQREEVLYYHPYPGSTDKITPRIGYTGRIETKGSLSNHNITISNLTVNDSGFYSCVYIKNVQYVRCSNYTLFISGVAPCSTAAAEVSRVPVNEKSLPLVLIIIATCTVSTLVTVMLILLIVPRVKRWTSRRRRTTTSVSQVSSDYVYEVMNGFRRTQKQQSPPNP